MKNILFTITTPFFLSIVFLRSVRHLDDRIVFQVFPYTFSKKL